MKFTLDQKLIIAKDHAINGTAYSELVVKYGMEISNIKYICRLYDKWGEEPFKKTENRIKYTREMKLNVIKDIISKNKSYRDAAVELKLTNPNIVRDWLIKYKEGGEEAITDTYAREAYKHHDDKILEKEHKKLLEDLRLTKLENDYLKKSYSLILARGKQLKKK